MMTERDKSITFSTHELSIALNVTKRQLQWWVEDDRLVRLERYGRSRAWLVWTFADALRAGVIGHLINLGMRKAKLREALATARIGEAHERYLIIDRDGRTIRAATAEAATAVLLRLSSNGKMGALIDLSEIESKLRQAAASAEAGGFPDHVEYAAASGAYGQRYTITAGIGK